jgi:hypothetical protein
MQCWWPKVRFIARRHAPLMLSIALLARPTLTQAQPVVPLAEAATRVGSIVTVEFTVLATGHNPKGFTELYSQPRWDDAATFFVRLPDALVAALTRLGIRSVDRHFRESRIRATGRVERLTFGDRSGQWPCVTLADLQSLQVLAPLYERRTVAGFTLYIHPEVLRHSVEAAAALAEIARQLAQIQAAVPPMRLSQLRTVPLRLEWVTTDHAANYAWLEREAWDDQAPESVDAVVLNHAVHFVTWSQGEQPWMLLHELAHALHHRYLGGDRYAGIRLAYEHAMHEKLYDSVGYVRGGRKLAYATTDAREYFAELSEAWFGRNDFFPFTRAELELHDPQGFELMRQVWEATP